MSTAGGLSLKGDAECWNREHRCSVTPVVAEQKPRLFHQYLSIPRNFATGLVYMFLSSNIFGHVLAFTPILKLTHVAGQHGTAVGNNEAAHPDWTGASQMLRS